MMMLIMNMTLLLPSPAGHVPSLRAARCAQGELRRLTYPYSGLRRHHGVLARPSSMYIITLKGARIAVTPRGWRDGRCLIRSDGAGGIRPSCMLPRRAVAGVGLGWGPDDSPLHQGGATEGPPPLNSPLLPPPSNAPAGVLPGSDASERGAHVGTTVGTPPRDTIGPAPLPVQTGGSERGGPGGVE